MLSGEKILITGPAGSIAYGIAASLVKTNEVWGIARFGDKSQRAAVEALGVKTRAVDLANPDFSDVPEDFTYLLHLAVAYEPSDYDRAIRINAEGTGLLLAHCRKVKAALVMSTISVYKPHPDPWHQYKEDDPLGDILVHMSPPYSVSKIAQEGVVRFCARQFGIRTIIARMNAAYGPRGGLPVNHMKLIAVGKPVETRFDPCPYSPIYIDDIEDQVEPLLDAAAIPAPIVNWCGDETMTVQEWTPYIGDLLGVATRVVLSDYVPGQSCGGAADPRARRALTGPCKVSWKDGFKRTLEALDLRKSVVS